ncbi:MAG: MFS transporter [Oligoflexia bacterium]|nr:MFS transporter [Oligoflexia bacterium]
MFFCKKLDYKKLSYSGLVDDLQFFLVGLLFLGINQGILNSTFNNYLYDNFMVSADARGVIEFPRELPGFLSIVITSVLAFWSVRGWAIIVGVLSAVGIAGMGFLSPNIAIMVVWMFLWSFADHLFMSVESIVGLKLAPKNEEGKILGRISGMRNLAAIVGSFLVFLLMGHLHWGYRQLYGVAVATATFAAFSFYLMDVQQEELPPKKFVYKREYNVFYLMNILFGARKQIFLTFAPWVLVSVYKVSTDTMAMLFVVASAIGFIFRQYFGICVDRYGERTILAADAVILLLICMGFAFAKNVYFLYVCFIIDGLMFATRIARTTYLKKILLHQRDIAPTISFGISIDHAVSMAIPFLGGMLWHVYGYQILFLVASLLAFANFLVAIRIKTMRHSPV